jgi:diphthamide biosynthesis protein 2
MLALRFICGLLNANNTVVRISLREAFSHDRADDTKAFSYVSVSYAASSLLGPWLGGVMYGQGFLITWSGQTPWALPLCLVTLLNITCFLAVLVLQPETAFLAQESPSKNTTSLLKDKRFLFVLFAAWGHSFVFTGWETVYPTFAGVSGASWGEEWAPARVGGTFLAGGIALITYNLWLYPWLASTFTVVRVWIWSWMPPLVVLAVFPRVLTHLMTEHVDPTGVGVTSLNYCAQVVISVGLGSGFTTIQLIMNRHVATLPDGPAQLASAVGALASAQALARALSPAGCGALFSASFQVSFLSRAAAFDLLALTGGCLSALSAALLWAW